MKSIQYGSQEIYFELQYSNRKTLAIEVHPDSSVQVIAPEDSTISEIETKVEKRARWILKQQKYFEQFLPRTPEREYISGETHFYFGKKYLLKVKKGEKNQVKLRSGKLEVICKEEISQTLVKNLLAKWYYQHAENKFNEIVLEVYSKFKDFDFGIPMFEIRRMEKRWGSCNTINKITINPELIKAPRKCIEYVVIHEMCHFVERNHTRKFYNVLTNTMPNWEKWKNLLEEKMS